MTTFGYLVHVQDNFGQLTSAQTADYIFLTVNITFQVRNVLKEQAAKTLQNITFERRLSEGHFRIKGCFPLAISVTNIAA
jgi:hypothetical protein